MSDTPITQLGRYQVGRELGRGAMGVVYEAQDPMLDRTVAIKTILLPGDAAKRQDHEARFFQEARAAGRLNHPSIITIYDVGREGDLAYMAMELLPGIDLRQRLRAKRLSLSDALTLAAEIAEGLGFAHEHGVIHRDIKPANIMLSRSGHAKIMDFGIAHLQQSEVKTPTGVLFGTPRYMSPEQVGGRAVDHRSDIFSLGAVLYEMLAGHTPFDGSDAAELWHNIASAAHVPPSRIVPGLPPTLDRIMVRALEKAVYSRYQNAREMAEDLRNCRAGLKEDLFLPAAGSPPPGAGAVKSDHTAALPQPPPPVSTGSMALAIGDDAVAPTPTPTATATATVTAATVTVSGSAAGTAHWLLSPRFDSAPALQRVTAPGADDRVRLGRPPQPPRGLARLWCDADLRLAAAIVAAAGVIVALLFV